MQKIRQFEKKIHNFPKQVSKLTICEAKIGSKMEEMRRRRLPAAGRCENGVFGRPEDAKTASPSGNTLS